jgi:tRNA A-37 threonylcarbamoyl transferase component Bud32
MAEYASANALDIEQPGQLEIYLRSTGRVPAKDHITVQRLAGGVSNRTMLVACNSGPRWVIKQALAKLRVAVDWFADPVRVHREALAMRWLNQVLPAGSVPALVFEDPEQHLLAMECVPEPHNNWKMLLLAQRFDSEHVRQFGALLGTIHRQGCVEGAAVPSELSDKSLFEALRLEPYYRYTAEQVPEAGSFLRALVERTRSRHDTFVHGDFSPKNILVHHGRLVLLDHEVAHVGDPAFDVGFALAHLLSKAHYRVDQRDEFAVAADYFWRIYWQTRGTVPWQEDLAGRVAQHTLACLLSRVEGRSPLEYFQDSHRARQRQAVLALLTRPPQTVSDLIPAFLERI